MSAPISNSSTQTNNPTPTDQTGPASAVQTSVASTSSQGTITPTPTEADTINTTPLIWAFGLLVVVSLGVIWVVSQPWRLWQLKEWTIATGIGLPVGIVLVVLLTQGFGASATVTAAFVAATVAVATLILSAVNNMWGFNRARRIDTLKAWHDWDKDWGAAPAKVAEVFGSNVLDLQTVELMSQIRTAKLRGHLVVDETMVKAVSTGSAPGLVDTRGLQ